MRKTFACPFVLGETSHCPQSHVIRAPEIDGIASRTPHTVHDCETFVEWNRLSIDLSPSASGPGRTRTAQERGTNDVGWEPVPSLSGLISLFRSHPALPCRAFTFRRFAAAVGTSERNIASWLDLGSARST